MNDRNIKAMLMIVIVLSSLGAGLGATSFISIIYQQPNNNIYEGDTYNYNETYYNQTYYNYNETYYNETYGSNNSQVIHKVVFIQENDLYDATGLGHPPFGANNQYFRYIYNITLENKTVLDYIVINMIPFYPTLPTSVITKIGYNLSGYGMSYYMENEFFLDGSFPINSNWKYINNIDYHFPSIDAFEAQLWLYTWTSGARCNFTIFLGLTQYI